MDIKIINDKENAVVERREINFETVFEGATPNRDEIKGKLAAITNASTNLIIIDNMKTEFGNQKLMGYAKIYKDETRLKEIESNYQINRNKKEEKNTSK